MSFIKLLHKIVFVLKRNVYYCVLRTTYKNIGFGKQLDLNRHLQLHKNGRIIIGGRTRGVVLIKSRRMGSKDEK